MVIRTAVACACLAWAGAADAAIFRAYLASGGNDANPCTLTQPCRLLPAALAAVADGGEVWMLDSANFNTGPVAVGKSVGILAVPGAIGSVLALGGDALLIATPGVEVSLRNLVIAPFPGGGGTNGIRMTAGAALTVDKCLLAGLPQNGIHVSTAASLRLVDTVVRDSGGHGIWLQGGAAATITRSTASGNGMNGIFVHGSVPGITTADIADTTIDANAGGIVALSDTAGAVVQVSLRDSTVARNTNHGVRSESSAGAAVTLSASNNQSASNGIGIAVIGSGARAWVTGNLVSGNGVGLSSSSSGLLESACDNAVRNNVVETSGTVFGVPTPCGLGGSNANVAFVTSTVHAATLGSAAAYDSVCNARATAASLNNATNDAFFAWMSDGSRSAVSLPGTARGWIARDGKPFANTQADLLAGRILFPLRLDESGADVGADALVFTGTNGDGSASTSHCSNWTSTSGFVLAGVTGGGTNAWTGASVASACGTSQRLVCLGRTRVATVVVVPPVGARGAFLTVSNFTPGGGLAAADALCASEAAAAGRAGTFRALLATTTQSAAARFSLAGGTWARFDGVPIVGNAADLASGFFSAPLNVASNGSYAGAAVAWVGATGLGVSGTAQSTCNDWSTTSTTGLGAFFDRITPPGTVRSCSTPSRLYCLQL